MTLQRIWNDFKQLSWWKKILLFVPFVTVTIFIGLFFAEGNKTNEKILANSKEKTDTEVTTFMKDLDKLKSERASILRERKRIKQELKNVKNESNTFINRIHNADASELSVLAKEIRANSTSN